MSFQVPSNKSATVPPQAPKLTEIKLINYDFVKYGSSAERNRLLKKWDTEVVDAAQVRRRTRVATAAVASPVFVPAARDRATAWVAAAALVALARGSLGADRRPRRRSSTRSRGELDAVAADRGDGRRAVHRVARRRPRDRVLAGGAVAWAFAAGFAAGTARDRRSASARSSR